MKPARKTAGPWESLRGVPDAQQEAVISVFRDLGGKPPLWDDQERTRMVEALFAVEDETEFQASRTGKKTWRAICASVAGLHQARLQLEAELGMVEQPRATVAA